MPTPSSGGNRKQMGKRKHKDSSRDESQEEQEQKQRTIPDLFSRDYHSTNHKQAPPPSQSNKRLRRNECDPGRETSSEELAPITVDKMYKFTSSDGKGSNGSAFGFARADNRGPLARTRPFNSSNPSSFTPHTGAKTLKVKNLRDTPKLDQQLYFEKVWSQLDSALTAIFNHEKLPFSLEELYRGVEHVCRQGRAPNLAKNLKDRCMEHISGTVMESLLAKSTSGDEAGVLRAVEAAWTQWNARLVTVRSIFYYLDQSFLLHSPNNPVIYEMGLLQFRSSVFSDETLKSKVFKGACLLIKLDRLEDSYADPTLLRSSIKLFHDLKIYTSQFEPSMLESSAAYYKNWAATHVAEDDLASYVEKSYRLIEREMARCDLLSFDRGTKQKLAELLDHDLMANQKQFLLQEADIISLLRANNATALERLFSMLERKGMGVDVKSAFSKYIVQQGSSIVFDEAREAEMVTRLLAFKQSLDHIWRFSFHNHEQLGHTLRESFETFINQHKKPDSNWGTDNPKPGEMIAKHVDLLLKGGVRALQNRPVEDMTGNSSLTDEDAEINKQLDQVLDLFRFVHGKAVFEAFYKNDLARRLLMGRSASDEAEKSMLSRLKSECGSNFTHNLETMFKDMDLARDEMASYNALLREKNERPKIDLNVNVISATAWPSYPDVPVNIPDSISQAINNFEEFYNNKYSGRRLHWKHTLAHCQLKARFPLGDKELVVSSFQAIVLLLFNDVAGSETLSYEVIKKASGLSDVELKRTLQSLACAKYRVLLKKPKGKEVNEGDVFAYNAKFEDQKMRIKINQIQLKETKQENKTTHERVAADRHFETQAAIVRIMKSRKTITHSDLVAEVIKATKNRGQLELGDIKKNIDKLIEKDYIEREDNNRYKYIA
ncbi:Ubiquitin ligase subunit CulD [Trichophyton interdigitale]|uniref:Ubiquitin ligase subunit CulD n=1 Tax=Trichophyton interdigitale TaxID=101480 RepID=A0A9P4YM77_9EURO|nr:Ubiquitin ligase subunit CulD [Trichophyton interdigitale]KAF3899832.1 Ubiquitin ligase subunit CulD [Trichophyton interdigitale]KAG8209739.1 Ubiquitin ligase subunit CulD [Trichophyton interdigitale]